jgi:pimeloyl-ACP methyl ester carboxylesterase
MTEQQIDLPAGRVHYRVAGPDDGRPVVFVHGFLVDGTVWGEVPDRLAAHGHRVYVATWPLGSHRTPMNADADLSPAGIARVVLSFLDALDLRDVVLVGNDTGGAICQFAVDQDPARVGALVLTNCDAFEQFPPAPFGALFRLARHPVLMNAVMQGTRLRAVRNGPPGFGLLVRRRLGKDESRSWVLPYLTDAGIRRDLATFARGWRPADLAAVGGRLSSFDRPVLLCWAPEDRFMKIALAHRLAAALPGARLVEVPDAGTFVALDQPERVAEEIRAFLAEVPARP